MMGIMCGTLGQKAMTSWPQIVPYKETHQNAGQGVESEIAVVGADAKLIQLANFLLPSAMSLSPLLAEGWWPLWVGWSIVGAWVKSASARASTMQTLCPWPSGADTVSAGVSDF